MPRILYGSLFVCALPAALVAWALAAAPAIPLPTPHTAFWGLLLLVAGSVLTATGMASLWLLGGGLPMNAFPPPRYVDRGIYSLVPHPIYGGFVVVCGGVSLFRGSSSGLWLITPAVALACAALVLGYELPDLRARFAAAVPNVSAADLETAPSWTERLRTGITTLLPWLAVYGMLWSLGPAPGAFSTWLPGEFRWPVFQWTELFYASTYAVLILTPFLVRTRVALRLFVRRGLLAMFLVFSIYLWVPAFVPPRPFIPTGTLGHLLLLERTPFSGAAAFPSFHVVWALIAASVLGTPHRASRRLWGLWATAVSASCLATGMHSLLDVLAGIAAFCLVMALPALWRLLLRATETLANSWHEWRIGPMRIINHGAYGALAAFAGILLIDGFLPSGASALLLCIFLCAMTGAALWAQWVEGSPALLRPLGFYGGLIGAALGMLAAVPLGIPLWLAVAALSVAGPWIQALGRLRCLVQGCCHGRAAHSVPGIRYTHPRSRVCRLTQLGAVSVHATPLYSILWNVWTGLALLRLATVHASAPLVAGLYLILSGLGRFVEEAYRGEPQTRIVLGLRFYQWLAIACVVAGAFMTAAPSALKLPPFELHASSLALAVGCAAATWFITGIDFPESSRRFARLT